MKYKTIKEMLNNGLGEFKLIILYGVLKEELKLNNISDLYNLEKMETAIEFLYEKSILFCEKENRNDFQTLEEKDKLELCDDMFRTLSSLTYECDEMNEE